MPRSRNQGSDRILVFPPWQNEHREPSADEIRDWRIGSAFSIQKEQEFLCSELRNAGAVFGELNDLFAISAKEAANLPDVLDLLAGQTLQLKHPNNVAFIFRLLITWKAKSTVPSLIRCFKSIPIGTGDDLRWQAGNAICELMSKEDVDPVLELLSDSRYGSARQMWCRGVTKFAEPSARVREAMEMALGESSLELNALRALKRCVPLSDETVQRVLPFASHERTDIRRAATSLLEHNETAGR